MDRLAWMDLGLRPVWFPAACALSGAAFSGTTHEGSAAFLCSAVVLAGMCAARPPRVGAHLLTLAAFFALGAGLARLERAPPEISIPRQTLVEGVVREISPGPDASGIVLDVARSPDAPELAGQAVSLWARGALDVLPGQRVLVPVRLKAIAPPSNPGERDRLEELSRQGIVATGGFDPAALVVLSAPSRWQAALDRVHRELKRAVEPLSDNVEAKEVLLTLAAGERASVEPELQNDFAASGLAHVLSVSGLHVAVIALVVLWGLRRLLVRVGRAWRTLEPRRAAALLAIPVVWTYVLFTGANAPSTRSGVMASCAFLGLALWRRADPLNALAWAVLAILIVEPSECASLSFLLSVGAVAALILLSPALRQAIPVLPPDPTVSSGLRLRLARWREGALQTFCASGAVTLASAPLLASAFHRVSLAGLLSNIVCLPVAGLLTILGAFGAALFVVVAPLGLLVLRAGVLVSAIFVWAVHLFARMPGATLVVPHFGLWAVPFEVGLLVWALAQGRLRWMGALAPASFVAVLTVGLLPVPGLTVTFLSVGHGDAIVLRSGRAVALVDGGGVPQGADTGARFVIPYLRDVGVRHLDLAVLSHPHPDHALGLASTLLTIPTDRLWLGAGSGDGPLNQQVEAAAGHAVIERVEEGRATFALGEARIDVLGPPKDRELLSGVNDRSVVLRVRHGDITFLLTGDIEASAEETLDPGRITVIKAPHHGSRTSSSPVLLARTQPKIVVFCVGVEDRFGAPSSEVVDRYQTAGAECFRTDRDGAVEIHSDGKSVRVRTFRPSALPDPAACPDGPGCRPLARNDR